MDYKEEWLANREPAMNNGNAKLTRCQVQAIRASFQPTKELALKYDVSTRTIWRARTYRSYQNVPD